MLDSINYPIPFITALDDIDQMEAANIPELVLSDLECLGDIVDRLVVIIDLDNTGFYFKSSVDNKLQNSLTLFVNYVRVISFIFV